MAILNLPSILSNPSSKTLKMASLISLLIFLSYLLGIHHPPSSHPPLPQCSIPPSSSSSFNLNFSPLHAAASLLPLPPPNPTPIPFCPQNFSHHCPCHDPALSRRGRRCPPRAHHPSLCRTPRPRGYRAPVPWPESRRSVWFGNVPFKKLSELKADQNWVRMEGERFVFPGGGTSFPHGVEWYVGQIAKVVPLRSGEVRTVVDIGCGVGGFAVGLVACFMVFMNLLSCAVRCFEDQLIGIMFMIGKCCLLKVGKFGFIEHYLPFMDLCIG